MHVVCFSIDQIHTCLSIDRILIHGPVLTLWKNWSVIVKSQHSQILKHQKFTDWLEHILNLRGTTYLPTRKCDRAQLV